MTLVVGLIAKDGVVLASDSRMTTSTITSNDTVEKLVKLDSHIAVGIAGDGNLGIHLLKLIKDDLNFAVGIVKLVEQIRKMLKEKFDEYYSNQPDPSKRESLTLLVVGYEKDQDRPEVYELQSRDNFIPRSSSTGFNCIGIPFISEYILNRFYEKEITVKQAEILAAFCVEETGSQSHEVGGDIKVASFSRTKNFSLLTSSDINLIKEKCQTFHSGNKSKFYPETEP
jgi:20S proteasome, alpha and beta subunits